MKIHQIEKINNLDTLFIDSKDSPVSTVQIWFRAGSSLEHDNEQGIAHFLEHMFFKGTKKRPGHVIAKDIESFGGQVNAFTSFDYTCYYINCPSHKLDESVDIIVDMVSNPEFKNQELIPEREVVYEEFLRSLDNPSRVNFNQIQQNIFKNGYEHSILGTKQSIKSFSRKQLISFRKRFYNQSNSLLIINGNLSNKKYKDKITNIVKKHKIPKGPKSIFNKFELKRSSKLDVHQTNVRQASLTMATQAFSYSDPNTYAEDLSLSTIGLGDSSAMHQRLVQSNQVATATSASTMYFNDGGIHLVKFVFPFENFSKLTTEFINLLKEIFINTIHENQIEKIKNQYTAIKVFEKESIESFSFSLGHGYAQTGDINCEKDFIEGINKCSKESIDKALKDIFKKNFHFFLQVPNNVDKKKAKLELKDFSNQIKLLQKDLISEEKQKLKKSYKIAAKSKYDTSVKVFSICPGIKLIYRKNSITPTYNFNCYLKGGLTEEKKNTNGLYNLLTSVITKGFDDTNYDFISNYLDRTSTSLSSFSGKNAYGLTMHGQTRHFKDSFKLFEGSLLNANFDKKSFQTEYIIAQRVLENQKEDPVRKCFKTFTEKIFHDHPYSFNMIGTKKSLENIDETTISKEHFSNIKNKEIVFTYCGDLEIEELLETTRDFFENFKSRKLQNKKILTPHKLLKNQREIIEFDREQSHLFLGKPSFHYSHKLEPRLKLLNAYLSGMSSELFVETRDRLGLCYAVDSVLFSALQAGYFGIYIATAPEKTFKALDSIHSILENLQKNGLKRNQFEGVKKMIKGQSMMSLQTNDDYASTYSIPLLHSSSIDFFYKQNEAIENVTHQEFNKFVGDFLSTPWIETIVGRF